MSASVLWSTILAVAAAAALGTYLVARRWRPAPQQAEPAGNEPRLPTIPLDQREPDAIYQWSRFHGERLVARVVDPDIDEGAGEIRFREIYRSDYLLLPDPCEFRSYRIEIRQVGDAIKVDRRAPDRGRILLEVTADILGKLDEGP